MSLVDERILIAQLADGRFHSGEMLAQLMGVSRTAVWKHLQAIGERYGIEIHAVRGKGYRMPRSLELLSLPEIERHIEPQRLEGIDQIEILDSVGSTNRYLNENIETLGGRPRICLAERQTAGRGRRGRTWVSPYAANIYLSLYWRFDLPMAALNGLSLVTGVAAAQAVERLGIEGVALKWPNDIHLDQRKLGGILVEVVGQTAGPVAAIIGVGINIDMPDSVGRDIDQEWTDIRRALSGALPSRNRLAGLLIDELVGVFSTFETEGWSAFESAWHAYDHYLGREVEVHSAQGIDIGVYQGVDVDGGLILKQGSERRVFHAGEVSLRAAGVAKST